MLFSEYVDMWNNILSKPETDEALNELKRIYRDDIKSKRAEDKINWVIQLLEVLEKRDVISQSDTTELQRIGAILDRYCPHKPMPVPTFEKGRRTFNFYERSSRIPCDPEVKFKVYETIASDIGRNWPTFARTLSYMSERKIDELQHISGKERIYHILDYFESNCDVRKWQMKLLTTLIECRRKDLYERVQNVFATYKS